MQLRLGGQHFLFSCKNQNVVGEQFQFAGNGIQLLDLLFQLEFLMVQLRHIRKYCFRIHSAVLICYHVLPVTPCLAVGEKIGLSLVGEPDNSAARIAVRQRIL